MVAVVVVVVVVDDDDDEEDFAIKYKYIMKRGN